MVGTQARRSVAKRRTAGRAKLVLGWREWVCLPEFGNALVKAKIDTGARTSSIHAYNLHIDVVGSQMIARFDIAPRGRNRRDEPSAQVPITEFRSVRSSNGESQIRPVIRMSLALGARIKEVEVSLSERDEMGFRLLVGREAIRGDCVVDPGRSFLLGNPGKALGVEQ